MDTTQEIQIKEENTTGKKKKKDSKNYSKQLISNEVIIAFTASRLDGKLRQDNKATTLMFLCSCGYQ